MSFEQVSAGGGKTLSGFSDRPAGAGVTASYSGAVAGRYWVETLGCPKNQVDSDKLVGTLLADGMVPADAPDDADGDERYEPGFEEDRAGDADRARRSDRDRGEPDED